MKILVRVLAGFGIGFFLLGCGVDRSHLDKDAPPSDSSQVTHSSALKSSSKATQGILKPPSPRGILKTKKSLGTIKVKVASTTPSLNKWWLGKSPPPTRPTNPPNPPNECPKSFVKNGVYYKCGMNSYSRGPSCTASDGSRGASSYKYQCYGRQFQTVTFKRCFKEPEIIADRTQRCCNVCYPIPGKKP